MTLEEVQHALELVAGTMEMTAYEADECTHMHLYPSAADTGLRTSVVSAALD